MAFRTARDIRPLCILHNWVRHWVWVDRQPDPVGGSSNLVLKHGKYPGWEMGRDLGVLLHRWGFVVSPLCWNHLSFNRWLAGISRENPFDLRDYSSQRSSEFLFRVDSEQQEYSSESIVLWGLVESYSNNQTMFGTWCPLVLRFCALLSLLDSRGILVDDYDSFDVFFTHVVQDSGAFHLGKSSRLRPWTGDFLWVFWYIFRCSLSWVKMYWVLAMVSAFAIQMNTTSAEATISVTCNVDVSWVHLLKMEIWFWRRSC